ncbi:MAG: F-type H+-transporting ATPase subunit epsilon [Candidatus Omnitrophota bacterium]|jgi:F-type H+-transporting ATPase subunit epsilon
MAQTFKLSIVTPEDTIYAGEVVHLRAPGVVGYLGILVGHAPLVTPLTSGEISLKEADKSEKFFQVEGGFLEVGNNSALLLAEKITIK